MFIMHIRLGPPKVSDMAIKSCWVKAGYHHHPKKKRWNDGLQIVLGQMGGRKFQNWNAYSL